MVLDITNSIQAKMSEARRKEVLELVTQQYMNANEEKCASWFVSGGSSTFSMATLTGSSSFEKDAIVQEKEKKEGLKKRERKGSLKEKSTSKNSLVGQEEMYPHRSRSLPSAVFILFFHLSFILILLSNSLFSTFSSFFFFFLFFFYYYSD